MKIFLVIALSVLTVTANANKLNATPYNFAKIYIGHGKPYFLEIGAQECPSCKIMGEVLYSVKQENPNYNILYIDIGNDRTTAQNLGVHMIPTQIIYDAQGKEAYRHTGKLDEVELDESEFDAMAYGKKDQRFVVKPRDTKGMRGKQDQFKMYVVKIDNRGNEIKVIKDLGSHSSIAGAKKFAVNRGIIKEETILERIDRKLKERKNG